MSKRAGKPGAEWAVQSGRLLSLSAGLERQMKDLLAMQNARPAGKGSPRDILAGLVYGELRTAAEQMNSAFRRMDQLRALDEAEYAGKQAGMVLGAFRKAMGDA